MSRRRKHEDEHENHERWLVSYADFITLLFAFFVVMYAISSVNDGKYKILSDSINSAFRTMPGANEGALQLINSNQIPLMPPRAKPQINPKVEEIKKQNKEKVKKTAEDLISALGPLVQSGQVRVTEGVLGITLEINAAILFSPGDARLSENAVRILATVAAILSRTDFPVTVEGHTDNAPISNALFPSNWELSVVRASSVVRLFVDNGVDARRLTATGYADQRPIADNADPDGRQRNRRVAITIESQTPDNQVEIPLQSTTPKADR